MHPRKQRILDIFGSEPETLDELARCCIAVIDRQDKVAGFSWDISYHDFVRNSHNAPLDGVTNFTWRDTAPKGYPGWRGRVWIRYERAPKGWGSDPFDNTLTHPGTGGFGSYSGPWQRICSARFKYHDKAVYPEPKCYSWDYIIFLSDWPKIAEARNQERLMGALAGVAYTPETHKFTWEDPSTVAADNDFLKEYGEWVRKSSIAQAA